VNTSVNIIFPRYKPSPVASATFCYPSVSIWEVNVGVDIKTGIIVTNVSEIKPFPQYSNFSSLPNVTGPPLNGSAYNGIAFDLTNPDQFVLGRRNATQLQLPAAIYQVAIRSPGGYVGTLANGGFSTLSDKVYVGTFCLSYSMPCSNITHSTPGHVPGTCCAGDLFPTRQ
jgi:hypothetical protein